MSEQKVHCYDCGVDYESLGVDLVLPDQQWAVVFPEKDGILCANCICKRVKDLGGTVLLSWVDRMNMEVRGICPQCERLVCEDCEICLGTGFEIIREN